MTSIASRISQVLTAIILLVAAILLTGSRLEYCGQPKALRRQGVAATASSPTLAPPQKVVFVRVEADKSGLEVGWAEN